VVFHDSIYRRPGGSDSSRVKSVLSPAMASSSSQSYGRFLRKLSVEHAERSPLADERSSSLLTRTATAMAGLGANQNRG